MKKIYVLDTNVLLRRLLNDDATQAEKARRLGEGFRVIIKKGRQYSTKENRMSLNIKDPEAHRLAQTLAKETGESMTHAVTEALRERLQRVQRQRRPEATVPGYHHRPVRRS